VNSLEHRHIAADTDKADAWFVPIWVWYY